MQNEIEITQCGIRVALIVSISEEAMKRTASIYGFPIRLHLRSDLHLARKAWHMMMGLVVAFAYWGGVSKTTAIIILSVVFTFDLFVETMRLRSPSFNEKIMKVWGPIMRSCEMHRMSAVPHYLLASILAIAIFPKAVAVLSILYLACGDPVASLFGVLYGHKSIRFSSGKTLIGTLAGVLVCVAISILFLKALYLPSGTVLVISLVGGLAGGVTELIPFEVDDNFTIPMVSGFVLWLAFLLAGI